MKKKLLALITVVLCGLVCFSGCGLGSYIESGSKPSTGTTKPGTNPGNTPGDNPGGDETPVDTSDHYKATVIYDKKNFNPGDLEIYVVWRNEYSMERVELSADGTADAGVLDGDYTVYLEGLPSKYTYNPGAYTVTSDARTVKILIIDVMQPHNASRADGKNMYVNLGCYEILYDGTYRTELKSEDDKTFYEYTPRAAGYYSVVSWVNVYDDKINPLIDVYGGTMAFKWLVNTIDGGAASLSGGYTKNFRHEVRISASEVGGSFSFAIHATSKFDEFPLYVDFAITYEGPHSNGYEDTKTIRSEETLYKASEPKNGEYFVYADLGTNQFNMDNYKFNDDTGRYHFYNQKLYADDPYGYGVGYGPVLLCAITPRSPSYTVTSLYSANSIGPSGMNFLKVYNCWIEEKQVYGIFDYTAFIREDYYNVCNSQGYCNVTKELKGFLQQFSIDQAMYTDGTPLDGTPEANGYYAREDSMWLFACGFYFKGGLDGLQEVLNG